MGIRWFAATCVLAALTMALACAEGEPAQAPLPPELVALMNRAEAGDPAAQIELGDHYESGDVLERDDAEALKWYREAAQQGHLEGQYSMGVMIFSGRGQSEDRVEGAKWIRKSAEAGYLGACAVALRWRDLLGADPYAMKRMTVKGTESMARFRLRLRLGGMIRC